MESDFDLSPDSGPINLGQKQTEGAQSEEGTYTRGIGTATFSIRSKLLARDQSHKEKKPFFDTQLKPENQLNDYRSDQALEEYIPSIGTTASTIENAIDGDDLSKSQHQNDENTTNQRNHLSQDDDGIGMNNAVFPTRSLNEYERIQKEEMSKDNFNFNYEKETGGGIEDQNQIDEDDESLLSLQKRIRQKRLSDQAKMFRENIGKAYICDVCFKGFKQKGHFINHQRTHTGEKPFKCDECDKSFTKKHNLNVHKMGKHSGEKRFSCTTCGKSFAQKCQFIVHERRHTGEKPYECHVCYKSFPRKYNLTLHEKTHRI